MVKNLFEKRRVLRFACVNHNKSGRKIPLEFAEEAACCLLSFFFFSGVAAIVVVAGATAAVSDDDDL